MSAVAVVTGANRGIGWQVALQLAERGFQVVLSARDAGAAECAAAEIRQRGGQALPYALNVRDPQAAAGLAGWLETHFGQVDVLVNNAGVFLDNDVSLMDLSDEVLNLTLQTNLLGPIYLCRALVPLMKAKGYGRIVNVSSGYGALNDMGPYIAAYRISKAGLNALTAELAAELTDTNIKVNSVCPGWVRTEMGGASATRSPEEAAADLVWAATLDEKGPRGAFLRYREVIPW
ncbi:SDR family NAD(P)-dependent oxidoreductase [Ferrimonas balearica]|uniref:SDR family NAD(P)-dependent oxidoreductase n=1 Tax=Ferrimonas balearica TaxID=44012 RepID=UPI001C965DFF|nr:SDR family NAD(P)-dependent oxidoreductase [Ferrimonas balearica]MBY6224451.1 SDR family NAD(P)-dependent oxidoreductase [Ferrimonas balearica]